MARALRLILTAFLRGFGWTIGRDFARTLEKDLF